LTFTLELICYVTASTRDTMEEVELIINQVIASNNPALIKKHNGMLTKSLKDIHIRIENETSSEQVKVLL